MTGLDSVINAEIEALLAAHPPQAVPPNVFWGAQFDAGLAWVDFPVGRGGLDRHHSLQLEVDSRLREAGAPSNLPVNLIGLVLMAPTMVACGTDEQQSRYLRPAFTGQELWCQLFSEPGAGSDLASLSTRAERDGTSWVVSGQKVWTTMAHRASFALLLARTGAGSRGHAGLTYFVVDMHARGVEVRPLRQITGDAEYNEVFLDEVRVPDGNRIGPEGAGWKVAMSTLASERSSTGILVAETGQLLEHALAGWRASLPSAASPVNRDRLVQGWIEQQVLRLTSERAEQARRAGTPGPEGSITKLAFAQVGQSLAELAVDLRGAGSMLVDDYALVQPDRFTHTGGDSTARTHPSKAFLGAQALSIAGGTTNVNKNIVGERVLSLPREPHLLEGAPGDRGGLAPGEQPAGHGGDHR
jgi:alkylation response protein AidB-like acyl-CoA dehydrogenase